jgi:hypothetical protein
MARHHDDLAADRLDQPAQLPTACASRLELNIQNERPLAGGRQRRLRTLDMVDLTGSERPRRHELRDLSVRVTAPSGLPAARICGLVGEALARMAEDFGFTGPRPPGRRHLETLTAIMPLTCYFSRNRDQI